MPSHHATRLYPSSPREMPAEDMHRGLHFPDRGGPLPHVAINMVTSLDGRASVRGKASPIGSPTDSAVMGNLRDAAEAVMISSSTLAAEKLSLSVPLAAIVTNKGDILFDNLVGEPPGEMIIFAPEGLDGGRYGFLRERASLVMLPEEDGGVGVLLEKAMGHLKSERGASSVLLEGGPSLVHAAVSRSLVSELFLTLSPKLFGGYPESGFASLLNGPELPKEQSCELASLHLCESELFLRYSFT